MDKRHVHIFIIAVAVLICFSSISWAAPHGVQYTPHNLGTTGAGRFSGSAVGTTETEICIFCHTPHNAVAGKGFLWNRVNDAVNPTQYFALYTSSPTLNISQADKAAGISEISKMCLTCHDGATALNSMANPRAGAANARLGEVWDPADPITMEWGKNIGERGGYISGDQIANTANLTNDHPISFNYETVQGADVTIKNINAADGPKVNGLVFWGAGGNMLECVTCHDPHINYGKWDWRQSDMHNLGTYDPSLAPFLRRSNSSSKLCFSCHNK